MRNPSSFSSQCVRLIAALAVVLLAEASATTALRDGQSPPTDELTIVHALNRMGFGPAPGDVERVRAIGLPRYIELQLHPERLTDSAVRARLAPLATLTLPTREIAERYYVPLLRTRRELQRRQGAGTDNVPPGQMSAGDTDGRNATAASPEMAAADGAPSAEAARALANLSPDERRQAMTLRREGQKILSELGQQKILRAVYSERQLEEVLVDFWFNHFNVFAGKGPVRVYLTEYERDAIRPHVLGNFRELLGAVAASPAMLFYLDNWQSADPEMASRLETRTGRTSQAARLGARPGQRRGAGRLAGMSEEERERAMAQLQQRMPRGLNENYARELLELHTLGVDGGYTQKDVVEVAKAFTGWTIRLPRAGGGFWFDERRHVRGAKHVLGTTIDKGGQADGEAVLDLLAAHPSTATFIATKLARRFVSDEPPAALVTRAANAFRTSKGDLRAVTRTILTSPEFVAPDARRAKVKTPFEFVASALRASGAEISDGAALLRNLRELGMPLYFAQPPTGYADDAASWVNTGALVGRLNFAVALVNNRLTGVRTDLTALVGDASIDLARERVPATMLHGQVSEATKQTLARSTEIAQVAALTLGAPEFQRR